ncbi:Uncharacterized protein Fot_07506 [Forsythia ovata]|uniref:Uncharacterized protein n=1 Tax=Forsythia ovata TaxID=205694 RepID=A0ABD1WW08_9LAMI
MSGPNPSRMHITDVIGVKHYPNCSLSADIPQRSDFIIIVNSKPTPSATSRARFSSHGRARDSPAKVARDSSQPQSRAIPLSYNRFPEPQSRVILSATSRARFSATVTASPPPPVAAVSHRLQPSLP